MNENMITFSGMSCVKEEVSTPRIAFAFLARDRLHTSDSGDYRRQNLKYKVDPRTERVKYLLWP